MKKLIHISVWLLIASWFVVIMGFVSAESSEVLCNRMEVDLGDTLLSRFLSEGDVRAMLDQSGQSMQGYPISGIQTRELEYLLEKNPYVRNAEVSKEISGTLHVSVEQRIPLVRIMPGGRTGYYLDTEGRVLPLSDHFTPRILLATGHLPDPGDDPDPEEALDELYRFCLFLAEHPFWKEQIVQIYVNREEEVELIPRVGAHQILLGSLTGREEKLQNLELLYRQGFPVYGWNSYETINLKYRNQIICTKR